MGEGGGSSSATFYVEIIVFTWRGGAGVTLSDFIGRSKVLR